MNEENTYPLEGFTANWILGFESLILFLILIFVISLFTRYFDHSRSNKDIQNLAWASIFIGIGLSLFIFIYTDFMLSNQQYRENFIFLSYLSLAIGFIIGNFLLHRIQKSLFRPISMIILILFLIVVLAIFERNHTLAIFTLYWGIPVEIIFFIRYAKILYNVLDKSVKGRRVINYFFFSSILMVIGYALISNIFIDIYKIELRLIGDIIFLVGIHYFRWVITQLPDIDEFDWNCCLLGLLVIQSNGIPLFTRFWTETRNKSPHTILSERYEDNRTLLSAGINSIEAILNEIVGTQKLNRIQLEDRVIIFEKRENFITAVISTEYLESLALRLIHFTNKFDEIYGNILKKSMNNMEIFQPVKHLADIHFHPNH
jgi:hypothetical protein